MSRKPRTPPPEPYGPSFDVPPDVQVGDLREEVGVLSCEVRRLGAEHDRIAAELETERRVSRELGMMVLRLKSQLVLLGVPF